MSSPPENPKIYHITHLTNLSKIVSENRLWSHAEMIERGGIEADVAIPHIKRRRLENSNLSCHPGTRVGQFVPFNFCNRSVMLYIIYKGNHPDLINITNQKSMVHLEAELHEVVRWADDAKVRWAFTDRNSGCGYFQSFNSVKDLDLLNWELIESNDWKNPIVKEAKQAEFLVQSYFPWRLVRRVGVIDESIASKVREIIETRPDKPDVIVRLDWYY